MPSATASRTPGKSGPIRLPSSTATIVAALSASAPSVHDAGCASADSAPANSSSSAGAPSAAGICEATISVAAAGTNPSSTALDIK